uniref:lanC-like protein 3 n=1 Tax=Myxine glutinosa TaxID=7769 RepID=UPI00358DD970
MLERDGNWPPVMCEQIRSDDDQLVHWCHGAPGVALLFVKAFQLSGRPQYLAACERAAQCVWNKGLLLKGPGTCHGVAGNGYLFLVLYRLTQDPKYFYRAWRFMEFMFTEEFCRGARTPDSPYSLFEGLAGTACFLLDVIKPEGAEFPLYATL